MFLKPSQCPDPSQQSTRGLLINTIRETRWRQAAVPPHPAEGQRAPLLAWAAAGRGAGGGRARDSVSLPSLCPGATATCMQPRAAGDSVGPPGSRPRPPLPNSKTMDWSVCGLGEAGHNWEHRRDPWVAFASLGTRRDPRPTCTRSQPPKPLAPQAERWGADAWRVPGVGARP
jgi:hypothetical protein